MKTTLWLVAAFVCSLCAIMMLSSLRSVNRTDADGLFGLGCLLLLIWPALTVLAYRWPRRPRDDD